jgi:hypothetical protein
MTKLCPRGKAAAKRKFKIYPSAYANAYASRICAGKIKDPSGVKRKDFKGPKPAGKKKGGQMKYGAGGGLGRIEKATKAKQAKKENYIGSHIKSDLAGEPVSNKSYEDYYKGMI